MSDKKYVVYYHEKLNEYFYDYYSRFNMNEQYSKPVLYSDDFELIERAKNELNERLQEQSYYFTR